MWKNSKPSEYLSFRVFIFGITSQSMFPKGVVYEGIDENQPLYFRGESGANDSIVSLRKKNRWVDNSLADFYLIRSRSLTICCKFPCLILP
jgi:hypothetical protein